MTKIITPESLIRERENMNEVENGTKISIIYFSYHPSNDSENKIKFLMTIQGADTSNFYLNLNILKLEVSSPRDHHKNRENFQMMNFYNKCSIQECRGGTSEKKLLKCCEITKLS